MIILFNLYSFCIKMEKSNQGQIKNHHDPNVFYELLAEVGLQGNYQVLLVIFCSILCFQTGFLILGNPYFFAIAPYTNCPSPYQGLSECTKYACLLPKQKRSQFMQPQISQLKTLGNQFGDFHCQNAEIGEIAKGMDSIGAIFGYLVTGILGDKIGRKTTLNLCLVVAIIGYSIVLLSKDLGFASIGLFLCGFGIDSCFQLSLFLVSETQQNYKRQKITILIQAVYCFGGLFAVLVFYLLKDWKPIFLFFCLIPLVCCLFFNIFFIKQTPLFLIKRYSVQEIRQSLRFIAKINGRGQIFDKNEKLSERQISNLKNQYESYLKQSHAQTLTFFDLFRFESLRIKTVCLLLIFCSINFLYIGPVMLINEFGFDFYINGVILNISEMVTYLVTYFLIEKIPRKMFTIICLGGSTIASFSLIFLHTKQICKTDCFSIRIIFELSLVFFMRLCVCLHYQILYLYSVQLYPVQIVSIGLGFNLLIAVLGTSFVNLIISYFNKMNVSIMILFTVLSLFAILPTLPLAQTLGKPPKDKIEQIQQAGNQNSLEQEENN